MCWCERRDDRFVISLKKKEGIKYNAQRQFVHFDMLKLQLRRFCVYCIYGEEEEEKKKQN